MEKLQTPKQRSCFLGFHSCNFSNAFVRDLFCPLGKYQLGKTWEILPVTVKNVKEMRRFIPQFMLDVKAMARPLIPPGKISLRTNQDTEIQGKKRFVGRMALHAVNQGSPWIQVRPSERVSWFSGPHSAGSMCSNQPHLMSPSPHPCPVGAWASDRWQWAGEVSSDCTSGYESEFWLNNSWVT